MVQVYERELGATLDVGLSLAALEDDGYGEERGVMLEVFVARESVRLCERGNLWILSHGTDHAFERPWDGRLAGHAVE